MKPILIIAIVLFVHFSITAQNYSFNFNSTGRRVCLVSTKVDLNTPNVTLLFHDSLLNTNEAIFVNRRLVGTTNWTSVATNIPAGTGHWTDNNVNLGEMWEYQVKRNNTWSFSGNTYDATGYTIGALLVDNTNYKGQLILLVANDVPSNLATHYTLLKKELTADGWFIQELIVPRATNWDSGSQVLTIKNQVKAIYNNAPFTDKPKALFILGHVPMPRSGSTHVVAPDDHNQNEGARGCDGYYADIDGIYTDTATFNPSGLSSALAINLPGDYKWDQDFFPSDVEMAFGRIDFADITDLTTTEYSLLQSYLIRLSNYKNVANGHYMGEKSAFNFGYNNSNDGSYRSLLNISKPENVFEKNDNSNTNQWVQSNGPFKIYMQNVATPSITDWQTYGMNATVFSSDQSYWGFGDVPQPSGVYSRIRSILGVDTKCLVALWTTTGLNIFHEACTGKDIGQSLLKIINHNSSNNYLEKPPQQYDTPDWWNRTHFEIWGDPTITLYQVEPITNLTLNELNGTAVLQWNHTQDSSFVGFHVYEASSEFGKYDRISTTLVTSTSYQLTNYHFNHWYMVKAVHIQESGCGKFLHPSLGKNLQADLPLTINELTKIPSIMLSPNPTTGIISMEQVSDQTISFSVFNALGQLLFTGSGTQIDLSTFQSGIYLISINNQLHRVMKE
jgi:hypothetical protein|uniref:T9SS type A sorting domain-containing protein n=1 Tax=Fluviicola sp. TaxID=1917219 RepID=UPI004049C2CC